MKNTNTYNIPLPQGKTAIWFRNGSTQDIINSVNRAAVEPITAAECTQLAAKLCGNTVEATSRNIYKYLRTLNYKEDEPGKQYIPTLGQIIHKRGRTDCKGMSLITAGVLQNLNIPYYRRYARYPNPETGSHNTEVTHVYTVVPTGPDTYICIDGTLSQFIEAPGALEVFDYKDNVAASINGVGQNPFYPGYEHNPVLQVLPTGGSRNLKNRPSLLVIELKKRYDAYADSISSRPSMIGKWKWTPGKDIKDWVNNTSKYSVSEINQNILNAAQNLPAREAMKLVIENNVLGTASVLAYCKLKDKNAYEKILTTWYVYGGDPQNFDNAVSSGKTKSPRQVAPAVLNRIPKITNYIEKANTIYYDKLAGIGVAAVDDATVATAAVQSVPIWLQVLTILGSAGVLTAVSNKYIGPGDGTGTGTGTGTGNNGNGGFVPEESFLKKNAVPLTLGAGAVAAILYFI